jgi:hypothetical protein
MSDRDASDRRSSPLALSRRAFLGRAGLLTGGLLALGPGGLLRAGPARAQLEKALRPTTAGGHLLTLDGAPAGFVQALEGGSVRAEVIEQMAGPTGSVNKTLGPAIYEPIRFRADVGGMSQRFWELVGGALQQESQRIDGAFVTTDFSGNAVRELAFTNALISEIRFPALDAAAKELAYVEIVLAPQVTRTAESKGAKVAVGLHKGQKKGMLANFRFEIPGMKDASKHVNRIESFTIERSASAEQVGAPRDFLREPGRLVLPNLALTLPLAAAKPFQEWHRTFVIEGKHSDAAEKSATLELLTPNLDSSLLTLQFGQLGILALAQLPAQSGDAVARVRAEFYFESLKLVAPAEPKA